MKANHLIIAGIFFALGAVFMFWQLGGFEKISQAPVGDETKLILETPEAYSVVESPLVIEGKLHGNWFFEASAPIELQDDNGKVLATGLAQAKGDWMTTEFVDFTGKIIFQKPTVTTGWLVFKKDNPSGLPEQDDEVRLPIKFE